MPSRPGQLVRRSCPLCGLACTSPWRPWGLGASKGHFPVDTAPIPDTRPHLLPQVSTSLQIRPFLIQLNPSHRLYPKPYLVKPQQSPIKWSHYVACAVSVYLRFFSPFLIPGLEPLKVEKFSVERVALSIRPKSLQPPIQNVPTTLK